MADVTGPISTLPGAVHPLPEGQMCDTHPERPAKKRVQGETDSMGCELNDLCDECLAEDAEYEKLAAEEERFCDWCNTMAKDVKPKRDSEEGRYGRVYNVCKPCRTRRDELEAEEMEFNYSIDEDYFYD